MDIEYTDEYGSILYSSYDITVSPTIGTTIIVEGDEYKVKDVVWDIVDDLIKVVLTQNSVKSTVKETESFDRLNQLHTAILAVSKRQDVNEKKTRAVTEQVATVRKHINKRIQQDKNDNR